MHHDSRRWIVANLVSPYGLAAISYTFFLMSWALPPGFYARVIHEPDLMFLDPLSLTFYTACVVGFVLGVAAIGGAAPRSTGASTTNEPPVGLLLLPLFVSIAWLGRSIYSILHENSMLLLWLLSQQGSNLKATDSPVGQSDAANPTLIVIAATWWCYWHTQRAGYMGWRKFVTRATVWTGVLFILMGATIILSRAILMMAFSGIATLYVARWSQKENLSLSAIIRRAALLFGMLVLLFFFFSFLRGTNSLEGQVGGILAYTSASYNRLAALLDGRMRYPYGGTGVYLFPFLSYSHLIHKIVPLDRIYGWPEYVQVWSTEFGAVTRAGLSDGAIWSGAFGYLFSDLGWYTPCLLFGYGLVYGVVWKYLVRGHTLAIVVYPALSFCVLFWFGSNFTFDSQMVTITVAGTALALYDRFLSRKGVAQSRASERLIGSEG